VTSASPSVGPSTEFPPAAVPPPSGRNWSSIYVPLAFMLPAAFFLGVWVIYPTIATINRSFWSNSGGDFVGLDNYQQIFEDDRLLTALKNNALWVLIIPAAVTSVGLIFAVLVERIFWATAFKIALFIPLAVSLFAVGVIWRIMYQKEPDKGAINALIQAVRDPFAESGVLTRGQPSTDNMEGSTSQGFELKTAVRPGDVALLGLTGLPASELAPDAPDAVKPEPLQGGITGTVWRDFSPDSDKPGEVEPGEVAIAGATVELRDADGKKVESTKTENDGTYRFENVEAGEYRVAVGSSTFAAPFEGVNWLGESLITPAIMFAYIWVTAGLAMVIIGAGLAAIPRDVLEAARTDGGSELQIFRRVTVPLLAPVLTVVFVTQIIGVLKIFDLILAIAPGSSQDDAATLAFVMWQRSFSGQNLFGLGAAISTFMLLLFIPFLIINVRRFRAEAAS
jgi:alpha-glucoside transport system permease protein